MKRLISNKTKKIISVLILGVFVFSFLHSELGLFNFDDGNHETHDYCLIVDGTTNQINKISNAQQLKPSLEKIACLQCINELPGTSSILSFRIKKDFLIPKDKVDLFLRNSSFLI